MAPGKSLKVQFTDAYELREELVKRSDYPTLDDESSIPSTSSIAKRDLRRYYELLRYTLLKMPSFSYGEAGLLVDVFNAPIFTEASSVSLMWAEIEDAVRLEQRDGQWKAVDPTMDTQALIERLKNMSRFECMAVADAIERYWAGPYRKDPEEETMLDAFKRVDLVHDEPKRKPLEPVHEVGVTLSSEG